MKTKRISQSGPQCGTQQTSAKKAVPLAGGSLALSLLFAGSAQAYCPPTNPPYLQQQCMERERQAQIDADNRRRQAEAEQRQRQQEAERQRQQEAQERQRQQQEAERHRQQQEAAERQRQQQQQQQQEAERLRQQQEVAERQRQAQQQQQLQQQNQQRQQQQIQQQQLQQQSQQRQLQAQPMQQPGLPRQPAQQVQPGQPQQTYQQPQQQTAQPAYQQPVQQAGQQQLLNQMRQAPLQPAQPAHPVQLQSQQQVPHQATPHSQQVPPQFRQQQAQPQYQQTHQIAQPAQQVHTQSNGQHLPSAAQSHLQQGAPLRQLDAPSHMVNNGSIRQPGQTGMQGSPLVTGTLHPVEQSTQSQAGYAPKAPVSQAQLLQMQRNGQAQVQPQAQAQTLPVQGVNRHDANPRPGQPVSSGYAGNATASQQQGYAQATGYGTQQYAPANSAPVRSSHSAEYLQKEAERKAKEDEKKRIFMEAMTNGVRLHATKCPDGEGHYYATGSNPKPAPKGDYCVDVAYEARCPGHIPIKGVASNFIGMSGCFGDTYKIEPKPACPVKEVTVVVTSVGDCK